MDSNRLSDGIGFAPLSAPASLDPLALAWQASGTPSSLSEPSLGAPRPWGYEYDEPEHEERV
ncbi:MAG TPA: hypothetical protein VFP50_04475 [Anaeromyxobacteraceae bacterium]|nr:hypothetical protein [Anaeromyxobacteraceae bacterium]